ncbi:hypothetical protein ACPOL_0102 [Acidisarcina polymorpha]|uniref:DUF5343 domain-containing protein n=1 Tax=Acidisarcina polymorpha TaxID=2211140 RepID=A0A2Z5FRZ6_9BACT|nr:DUF5343 domain-containing protein [Acidisarcina polymorpha]AXC09489.1 hypothetical protein ACPOL_0102 [Acidisarcina polymorpha]
MPISLPYLASPGSIKTALDKIKVAATPDRVTGDFVSTKIQMKGGAGAAIPPFLKKIGFVGSDGSPTEIYKRFRNDATSKTAVAEAIKIGYLELEKANEYFYELDDKGLMALITQVTGAEANSPVSKLTLSTLKTLKSLADFETKPALQIVEQHKKASSDDGEASKFPVVATNEGGGVGLNLAYTINLNLPASTDQAVFNAIFRSLKEHLLSNED